MTQSRLAPLLFYFLLPGMLGLARADSRILEVAFDAKSVVTVDTKPGVATMVEFGRGEHVLSVGGGQGADCSQVADAWCVAWPAASNFLYVRPKLRAGTALTLAVVTDRHSYSLQFVPIAPSDGRQTVFRLVFTYPDVKAQAALAATELGTENKTGAIAVPVITEGEIVRQRLKAAPIPVNSLYTIAFGKNSEELQPALVFDDGRFTYLRWPGNREIPAVFEIRADGSEMVANTRMQGDLIVVDRVARAWMLRSGGAVVSLRNESFDPEGTPPLAGTTVPGVERVLTVDENAETEKGGRKP